MKPYAFLILLSVLASSLCAQSSQTDSILNDIIYNNQELTSVTSTKDTDFHFIYWGLNYDSGSFYAGREVGNNNYNMSSQLYYFSSKGYYAGVSGAWHSQLAPQYSSTVASIGYGKSFNNAQWLRYSGSLNKFFFNTGNSDYSPSYTGSISVGLSAYQKWYGVRTRLNVLGGKKWNKQASVTLYNNYKLVTFGKQTKLQFKPSLQFYMGSETVLVENDVTYEDYLLYGDELYSTDTKFGLLNAKLELPLSVSYKNFDLEVTYSYNIPRSLDSNVNYNNTSYVSASVGYMVSLGSNK